MQSHYLSTRDPGIGGAEPGLSEGVRQAAPGGTRCASLLLDPFGALFPGPQLPHGRWMQRSPGFCPQDTSKPWASADWTPPGSKAHCHWVLNSPQSWTLPTWLHPYFPPDVPHPTDLGMNTVDPAHVQYAEGRFLSVGPIQGPRPCGPGRWFCFTTVLSPVPWFQSCYHPATYLVRMLGAQLSARREGREQRVQLRGRDTRVMRLLSIWSASLVEPCVFNHGGHAAPPRDAPSTLQCPGCEAFCLCLPCIASQVCRLALVLGFLNWVQGIPSCTGQAVSVFKVCSEGCLSDRSVSLCEEDRVLTLHKNGSCEITQ